MRRFICAIIFSFFLPGYGHSQCWQSVSPGVAFSIGIKTDGTLWAWGLNDEGQLGTGNTTNHTVPVQAGSDNDWQTVSAGYNQVHAIKTDGTLWGWGYNGNGQLGTGGYGLFTSPIQIGTDNNWQSVSAGVGYSMAIKTDGTLWGWGDNFYGQVGIPGTPLYLTPQQVGTATDWQMVAASSGYQTLALKTNGTLWACGYNSFGQLGTGDYIDRNTLTQIGTAANWQSVEASYYSSYAIKTDGTLWSWGKNDQGQLGNGNNTNINVPVQEVTLAADWLSVSGGQSHCQALKTDNTLWFWGYGYTGETFQATNTPEQVGTATDWQSIVVFWNHTLATKSGNTAWAWGDNFAGELGDGTTDPSAIALPITCNIILPVTWLYVNGQLRNNNAIIKWATASENNTDKFEIEHSTNGISYSKLGTQTAAGISSSERQYEFIHPSPAAGKNFYRIKQIDLDGKFVYSSIVLLQNSDARTSLIIAPNPVQTNATLFFNDTGSRTIQLFSMNGTLLDTEKINGVNSSHTINMAVWAPGVYLLRLYTPNGTETYKIIKQ